MTSHSIRSLVALSAMVVAVGEPAHAKTPAGRYVVSTDGKSVLDTKTKLTWQQAAPNAGYTWAAAKSYCADPATATLLGGAGWRLPTIKELMTVLDYSLNSTPMFDSSVFTANPQRIQYWSSTPNDGSTAFGWYVDVWLGGTGKADPASSYGIRCVR